MQDTFTIAFKKAKDIKPEAFLTYLQKVTVHESIRKRDTALRQQNIQVQLDEHRSNLAESTEIFLPETHFQNKESKTELLQILRTLPKRQWKMIYMYYYAEFSTKEIVEMLDCSEGHVRNTMHIARQTLKAKLEGTKISLKGTVLLPLSAIFILEEEAFAATYTPPPLRGLAESAGQATVTTAAKSATPYIVSVNCGFRQISDFEVHMDSSKPSQNSPSLSHFVSGLLADCLALISSCLIN